VQAGAAFADILDSKLRDFGGEPPFTSAASSSRPITPPLFVFTGPQVHFHSTPYAGMGWTAPRPSRPARKLTAAERIAEGMSLAELRSAYRRLARRYHPDRHPASTDGEKERLSGLFAEVTAHYRRIAAALERENVTVH
jgi:DnaJ-like protein